MVEENVSKVGEYQDELMKSTQNDSNTECMRKVAKNDSDGGREETWRRGGNPSRLRKTSSAPEKSWLALHKAYPTILKHLSLAPTPHTHLKMIK